MRLLHLFLLSFLLCTVSAQLCIQGGPKPDACPDTNRWDNVNCRWICETPVQCFANPCDAAIRDGLCTREACVPDYSVGCNFQCKSNTVSTCVNGQTRQQDCNTCTCKDGIWICTQKLCGGPIIPLPSELPKTCTSNEGFPIAVRASYKDKCNDCTCGDDGKSSTCTRKFCTETCYDDAGKGYQAGDTRNAADGCNTCTCGDTGVWGCTKKLCPTTTTQPIIRGCVSNEGKSVAIGESYKSQCNTCTCQADGIGPCTLMACFGKCWDDNGKAYQAGQQRNATDGCNTCTCGDTGVWGCTRKACPVPTTPRPIVKCVDEAGKSYLVGDQRKAADGCNTCTCGDTGVWGCTRKLCPVIRTGCISNEGFPVNVSATFRRECNTCTCNGNDEATCTEMFCQEKCYDDTGKGYQTGATRKDRDGCNTCTCSSGGNWQCTLKFCLPSGAPTFPTCPKTCTMLCIGGTTCEIRNCQQVCVPKKTCPDVCATVRCANGPCVVDKDCKASCATKPGSVVLTATFNITWTRTQTASAIASAMRTIANNANVISSFLINNADIKKITGTNKWTVKVAFKGTPAERRTAYDKFMTTLSQAGLNPSTVTISGVVAGGGGLSRDGGAIGGANPLLLVSEDDELDTTIETMSIQSCENGQEIPAEQQCPAEEMFASIAESDSSSSSTRSLVPIIGAAVGGAVMLTLIIVTIIAIRRRRANSVKAMNYVQREGEMTSNPAVTMV